METYNCYWNEFEINFTGAGIIITSRMHCSIKDAMYMQRDVIIKFEHVIRMNSNVQSENSITLLRLMHIYCIFV